MSWQCAECGRMNDNSNLRCACGHELDTANGESSGAAIDKTLPPTVLTSVGSLTEQELRTFIGKEADYYLKKWQPVLEGRSRKAGFNWAAFFLPGLWFPYRKMYKPAFILYGISLIKTILEEVLFVGILGKQESPFVLDALYTIVVGIVCGAFGNIWYLSHTRKVTNEIQSQGLQGEDYLQPLSRRGGINLKKSLGLFILFLLINFLIVGAIKLFPLMGFLFCPH